MQTPGGTLLSPTPLVTAVTPSRSRAAAEEAQHRPSSGQHIRVVLRIKPPAFDPDAGVPCIVKVGADALSIAAPLREDAEGVVDLEPRTPSRPATPGRSRPSGTPGRAGAATPNRFDPDRIPGRARTPSRGGDGDKSGPAPPRQFTYDAVAGPGEPQSAIFDQARPLVLSALAGGNACVLAYGQTGSGKTYSMVGESGAPGVIPRAFELIWDRIDASPTNDWHVTVTCVELYNEGFRDLLAHTPAADTATPFAMEAARRAQGAIALRETKGARGGPPVAYLTGSDTFRHPVPSRAAMAALLARALGARHTSATAFNERSSRSHVLITVNLDSKPAGCAAVRCGKLHLVDLAGSEASDAAADASRAVEARAINSSLNALGDVLQTLSRNARRPAGAPPAHAPYRNHKLTRLLADSLGGGAHTLMVATVQAGGDHFRPSLTTLRFAARARDIVSGPGAEAAADLSGPEVTALQAKLADLRARLHRREAEIEALEELQAERAAAQVALSDASGAAARQAIAAAEARRIQAEAEAAEAGSREAASRAQLAQLVAGSAHVEAELDYEAACARASAQLAQHAERTWRLEAHRAEARLEEAEARAAAADAELGRARALARADSALEAASGDVGAALQHASDGWRADREALAGALEALAAAQAEADGAAGREAAVQQALGVAARASAIGCAEMAELKKLLEVLDEEGEADSASAAASLTWLRIKVSEVAERFDARQPPELQQIIASAAPELAVTSRTGAADAKRGACSGARRKAARAADDAPARRGKVARKDVPARPAVVPATEAALATLESCAAPHADTASSQGRSRGGASSRGGPSSSVESGAPTDHASEAMSLIESAADNVPAEVLLPQSSPPRAAATEATSSALAPPPAAPITAPLGRSSPCGTAAERPSVWSSLAALVSPARPSRDGAPVAGGASAVATAEVGGGAPPSKRGRGVLARAAEAFFPGSSPADALSVGPGKHQRVGGAALPKQRASHGGSRRQRGAVEHPGAEAVAPTEAPRQATQEDKERRMKAIRAEAIAEVLAASAAAAPFEPHCRHDAQSPLLPTTATEVPPTVEAAPEDQLELSAEGVADGGAAKRKKPRRSSSAKEEGGGSAPRPSRPDSLTLAAVRSEAVAEVLAARAAHAVPAAEEGCRGRAAPPPASKGSKAHAPRKSDKARNSAGAREPAEAPAEDTAGAGRPKPKPFKVGGFNKGLLFVPVVASELPKAAAPGPAPPFDVLSPHRLAPNAGLASAANSPAVAPSQSKRQLFNPKKGRKNSGLCDFNAMAHPPPEAPPPDDGVEMARKARRDRRTALGLARVSTEAPMAPPLGRREPADAIPLRGPLVA